MYPIIVCPSCASQLGHCLILFYIIKQHHILELRQKKEDEKTINYRTIAESMGFSNICCVSMLMSIELPMNIGMGFSYVLSNGDKLMQ